MDPMKPLEALGRHVAAGLDREPREADSRDGAAGLSARWLARRRLSKRTRLASIAALAALTLGGAVFALRPSPPAEALRFSFGANARPGQVGALLAAQGEKLPAARFSDGTRFVLGPDTRARVQAVRSNGADLAVEGGTVRSEVVPGKEHLWRVNAGPFTVLVKGTRFDTRWVPESDLFELSLYQGKVGITGCGMEKQIDVHAGETVRASCQPFHYEVSRTPASAEASWPGGVPAAKVELAETRAAAPSRVEAPRPEPRLHERSAAPVSARPETAVAGTPLPSSGAFAPAERDARTTGWRALLRENRYGDAVNAATLLGFERECASSNAVDLKALADAAYSSGETSKAELAYTLLRRRFPGTPQAATAAYSLGRLHFDMRGAYGGAAQWFQTYLRESPNGSLSREALGRLMEAEQRSGDLGSARNAAQRYLALHPDGPHAQLARRLLETR